MPPPSAGDTRSARTGDPGEVVPVALDAFALSLRAIVPTGTIGLLTFSMFRRECQGVVIAEGAQLGDSSF